jgi:hypothetical protein
MIRQRELLMHWSKRIRVTACVSLGGSQRGWMAPAQ